MSVQILNHSVPNLSVSIQFRVNASVSIDRKNAHILIKYSMKNCANVDAQKYSIVLADRSLTHKHVNASVLDPDHSVLMLKNLMTLRASASAQIHQRDVPTLRFSITIFANVVVLTSSDALGDRSLIQIPVSVNALNQSLDALTLRNLMTLRAIVSAQIDQRDALIVKHLIMTLANAAVLISSDAPVGKGLIQIHVNVSVLNQSHSVLMLRNLTMWHASVSVQIDRRDVPIHKYLTMTSANVAVLGLFNALVDRDSIQIRVNVNAQNLNQYAQMIRNSTMWHVNVFAQTDQRVALTLRLLTTICADVSVLIYSDALVDRDLIQIHVNVNVLNQSHSVLMFRNLTMWHASVSAQIDWRNVPIHKPLTMTSVNVTVLGLFNALVDRDSIQIRVNVNARNLDQRARTIRILTVWHANVSARID